MENVRGIEGSRVRITTENRGVVKIIAGGLETKWHLFDDGSWTRTMMRMVVCGGVSEQW